MRFLSIASFVLVFAFAAAVAADETTEGWDVTVENAIVSAAERGGRSVLQFRLDNASSQDFVLRAVRSSIAESASLMMRMPVTGPMGVKRVFVLSGEIVDFSSNHLWIEFGGLKRDLVKDEMIEFELGFDEWTLSAEAHVHDVSNEDRP